MTTEMLLGYAGRSGRREVLMALRKISPGSAVVFARSPEELRERFSEEEPGTVGAIVGHTGEGVSAMNLAAAIAHDGVASEVVLVARGASGSLRSRARRAGVSQVFDATVAPSLEQSSHEEREDEPEEVESSSERTSGRLAELPQVEMIDEIEEPLELPMEAPHASTQLRPGSAAPILTVASGRGGVGKTTLVALMASAAARWGMNVAVVDLDLSCGNLYTCFGVTKGPDIVRIAPQGTPTPESMGRASVRCNDHIHLWGPCERPEEAELAMPHVATLLSYLSTRYDLVVADTSTTFTDGIAQAVQACDRLLVVHDERAGAVASAARVSSLAVRLGVARTRIVRVVNLGDPRVKPNAFEGRAEVGLETARMHRVIDGGVEAEDLLAAGKVDELASIDSDLMVCVSSLLAQTLAELGRLPDNEAARKASEVRGTKRRFALFGKHREAV